MQGSLIDAMILAGKGSRVFLFCFVLVLLLFSSISSLVHHTQ